MELPEITDEFMHAQLALARPYTLVLLREGETRDLQKSRPVVWEHGRRNMALREQGVLAVVCPVSDDSELCGLGIFTTSVEETIAIMEGDPGVIAKVFTYEVHPVRGFPGATLPG